MFENLSTQYAISIHLHSSFNPLNKNSKPFLVEIKVLFHLFPYLPFLKLRVEEKLNCLSWVVKVT